MMIDEAGITAFLITLRLAAVATVVLIVLGTPLAWWLARTESRFKFIPEAVVAMPLVLPPTVLGFYLLIALAPEGPIGALFEGAGLASPVFTFTGLVIGSVIYSLPFVVQPLQGAFEAIGRRPMEAAAVLGASPLDRFFTIAVPLARPGFLTAAVLGFAHTLGEFGVVLMIGGNIPGSTRVVSIAIYDHVEALEYAQAHWLAGSFLVISFVILAVVYGLNRRFRAVRL